MIGQSDFADFCERYGITAFPLPAYKETWDWARLTPLLGPMLCRLCVKDYIMEMRDEADVPNYMCRHRGRHVDTTAIFTEGADHVFTGSMPNHSKGATKS